MDQGHRNPPNTDEIEFAMRNGQSRESSAALNKVRTLDFIGRLTRCHEPWMQIFVTLEHVTLAMLRAMHPISV